MKTTKNLFLLFSTVALACGHENKSERTEPKELVGVTGDVSADEELRIRGGSADESQRGVTMIKVTRTACDGLPISSYCSAVIIGPNTVLTAAHCIAQLCEKKPVFTSNIRTPLVAWAGMGTYPWADKDWTGLIKPIVDGYKVLRAIDARILPEFGNGKSGLGAHEILSKVDLAVIKFEGDGKLYAGVGSKTYLQKQMPLAAAGIIAQGKSLGIVGYGVKPGWNSFLRNKGQVLFSKSVPRFEAPNPAAPDFKSIVVTAGIEVNTAGTKSSSIGCSGDSGAPLFNDAGAVIGILSASFSPGSIVDPLERCAATESNTFTGVEPAAVLAEVNALSLRTTVDLTATVNSTAVVALTDPYDATSPNAVSFSPATGTWDVGWGWTNTAGQSRAPKGYNGISGPNVSRAPSITTAPSTRAVTWVVGSDTAPLAANASYTLEATYLAFDVTKNTNCARYEYSFDNINWATAKGSMNQTAKATSTATNSVVRVAYSGDPLNVTPVYAGSIRSASAPSTPLKIVTTSTSKRVFIKLSGNTCGSAGPTKFIQADTILLTRI